MSSAPKQSKPKVIRAWALTSHGELWESWIYRHKIDLLAAWDDAGRESHERVVRVEIHQVHTHRTVRRKA